MENAAAVLELGILLLAAVGLGWLARRIGLPAVVGYLALGLIVSPFTPGFAADRHQVGLLADVGVVLLLFEVGIEVDILRLRREQHSLFWAAPLQILLTTLLAGAAVLAAGVEPIAAATLGLCVAMSSSVVVVNIVRSRRRTTDPATEEALLGWSILQDVTGVALAMAFLAALDARARPLPLALAGLGLFILIAVVVAWLLPRAAWHVREQHDLFLITSVGSGLAIAGVGAVVFSVPLALAAFVGGLAISEGPTTREIRLRLLPFRDLLAVLFFVGIGMLLDPALLLRGLPWLALFLLLIVVTKSGVAFLLARLSGLPRPLQLATSLGQIGEFSFVLASTLLAAGAIADHVYVALVAAVAISIGASAVLARSAGRRPNVARDGRLEPTG